MQATGLTSAMLLSYLDHVGGPQAVADVLRRCGLQAREAELRDPGSALTWETKIALLDATARVLDNAGFVPEMVSFALAQSVAGALISQLRSVASPELVLRELGAVEAQLGREDAAEVLWVHPGRAMLRFAPRTPGRAHPLECECTAALLAEIPALVGRRPGRVSHPECVASGAEACLFELRWQLRPGELLGRRLSRARWGYSEHAPQTRA